MSVFEELKTVALRNRFFFRNLLYETVLVSNTATSSHEYVVRG